MEVLWKYRGIKSWVEIVMPDKCHQKSFPITCQAFRALRLTAAYYPFTQSKRISLTCTKDDSVVMIWAGITTVFVLVPWVEAHGKPKLKNTRSSHIFKLFQHLRGPWYTTGWNVQANTHCEGLSGFMWPVTWPTIAVFQERRNMCGAVGEQSCSRGRKRCVGVTCV